MKIVWKPLPGSQTHAINTPCNETLYHGTRGPGKTDCQLMTYRRYVGQGFGSSWKGVIVDREYKALEDIISKSKRWFSQFNDGARFLSSKSDLKWTWPTGEELLFRHIKKKDDYEQFHGQEFPFIGINELTKYPTSECYDLLGSTNRTGYIPPFKKRSIPLMMFSTTNPHGSGHNWVKRRFIDPKESGGIVRSEVDVFNPQIQKREVVLKTQISIFGSYRENRYLDPQYIAYLESIKEPNLRRAWLFGDWDITAGGALDDLWKTEIHKVPRFKIPKSWRLVRSFDWGSSHPFSVGFWAVSNGEEIQTSDGRKMYFPPKSLIRCSELYGSMNFNGEKFGHNKGAKKSARKIAQEILEHEKDLLTGGWVESKFKPGPADSQIYAVNEAESGSIASMMENEGVTWTAADKSPGTRKNGLQMIRDMLENAVDREGPGLFVMGHCEAFLNTVPSIPRDDKKPDDVDTEAEDHVFDDTRYMVLDERPVYADKINLTFPT